jgi:hypothetical protein
MEGGWRGWHSGGEGRSWQIVREGWQIPRCHRENYWRRQSTRGKAEGEVDNNCQDNCVGNSGQGVPKVDAINAREPKANVTMPMMIAACVTGSVLILKANFMPPSNGDISEKEEVFEDEVGEGTHTKGRNPGTVPMAEVTTTAPPCYCGNVTQIIQKVL